MTQNDLNREVARATGESIGTIRQIGFLLDEDPDAPTDADSNDPTARIVDWDDLELTCSHAYSRSDHREPACA